MIESERRLAKKAFVNIIDCSYISEKMKEELKNLISTRAEELYPLSSIPHVIM